MGEQSCKGMIQPVESPPIGGWGMSLGCEPVIRISFFNSPTDAQVNCLKNNFKIYIKTAPTCFGAVTPSSGSALLVLAKVTLVKIVN